MSDYNYMSEPNQKSLFLYSTLNPQHSIQFDLLRLLLQHEWFFLLYCISNDIPRPVINVPIWLQSTIIHYCIYSCHYCSYICGLQFKTYRTIVIVSIGVDHECECIVDSVSQQYLQLGYVLLAISWRDGDFSPVCRFTCLSSNNSSNAIPIVINSM